MLKQFTKRDLALIRQGLCAGFGCAAGIVGESEKLTRYQIGLMLDDLGRNDTVMTMLASDMIQDAITGAPDKKRWRSMMRELMAMANQKRATG